MTHTEPELATLLTLYNQFPDAILWYRPIIGLNGAPEDFELGFANEAFAVRMGTNGNFLAGSRLTSGLTSDSNAGRTVLDQCIQVFQTGQQAEFSYYSAPLDQLVQVHCSRVMGGVLHLLRDRTREMQAELELQEQERKYRHILDHSGDGILLLRSVRDDRGNIKDFQITYANKAAYQIGKTPNDAVGKTVLEIWPQLSDPNNLQHHRSVAETGEPVRYETSFISPEGQAYGWFIISLTRFGDGVVSRFTDITQRKLHEQELEQQRDLLQRSYDASLNAVVFLEAVRNSSGAITDLRYLQINKKYEELTRKSEAEVNGKTLLDFFPKARVNGLFDTYRSTIETGIPRRLEFYYQGDGLDGWFDLSAVRVGEQGVFATFGEITTQKRDAITLKEQKKLLDNILKLSPTGITVSEFIRDASGNIQDVRTIIANDAAGQFTGIPKERLLASTAQELEPNLIASELFRKALQTLETGEPFQTQYFLEKTERWLEVAVSKLDDNRLINVFLDITRTKEDQLIQSSLLEELKRSNANLEEFAYAASHDLQEPIRKIHFFAEQLRLQHHHQLDEKGLNLLSRLEGSAKRMQLLIADLLTYSQASIKPPVPEPVDLNGTIKLVLSDLDLEIAAKKAALHISTLPCIRGYSSQLQQLFYNLLSNALKYARPDNPTKISIQATMVKGRNAGIALHGAEHEHDFYLIEVADNGIGFEQKEADRIFNVFTRLHGNAEYKGTGVGLAITRKVVENHNGYIWAESEPGSGAIFKVLLPA